MNVALPIVTLATLPEKVSVLTAVVTYRVKALANTLHNAPFIIKDTIATGAMLNQIGINPIIELDVAWAAYPSMENKPKKNANQTINGTLHKPKRLK